MLQAARTANRTRNKKKQHGQSGYTNNNPLQSRKSLRYGRNPLKKNFLNTGDQSPHTSSGRQNRGRGRSNADTYRPRGRTRGGSNADERKPIYPIKPKPKNHHHRKSAIFRPTHTGQSMAAMVEHSVMQQMNPMAYNQPSNHSVSHYNAQLRRRQSITARKRKKEEEAMIKQSVMMNASQHQQLLNLVKVQQPNNDQIQQQQSTNNTSTANSISPEINGLSAPSSVTKHDMEHQS